LQDLHIDALGVQRDLARHGDTARIAAQLVAIRRQLERIGDARAGARERASGIAACALRYRRRDATSRKAVSCRAPIGIERAHQKVGHFHISPAFLPLVDAGGASSPGRPRAYWRINPGCRFHAS
jgi:hypothetical protein